MTKIYHILMIAGMILMLGIAGRYDCDAAMNVASPSMIWWIVTAVALMIPDVIWFLLMYKKAMADE